MIADAHLFPEPEAHPGRDRLLGFLRDLTGQEPGHLWILGDLFEFWFEYRSVVPDGYHRVLAALRAVTDSGWDLTFLPGNHDTWVGKHFQRITGADINHQKYVQMRMNDLDVVLSHGDALGRGDLGYKLLLRPILRSPVSKALFYLLHPDLSAPLARSFSGTSRRFLRKDCEKLPSGLAQWAESMLSQADLVVTAHTHVPMIRRLPGGCHLSLGDWLKSFSYATLSANELKLYVNDKLSDSCSIAHQEAEGTES
jgi:UDP-2,3-diacylglucosamine hydrolase